MGRRRCSELHHTVWSAEFGAGRRFDARDASGRDELLGWLATAQRGARGIEAGQHFVEETTGIRFLWVSGGRFEIGMTGIAEPVHRVRLSPYWLAETPVTNGQYAKFLSETGHEEPAWGQAAPDNLQASRRFRRTVLTLPSQALAFIRQRFSEKGNPPGKPAPGE